MHTLNLPAGHTGSFVVTARSGPGRHRWDVWVSNAANGSSRLVFGSRIGGEDLHQRVEIPPQDADCRVVVQSRHRTATGWAEGKLRVADLRADSVEVAFSDPSNDSAWPDDVLFRFSFRGTGPEASEGLGSPRPPEAAH